MTLTEIRTALDSRGLRPLKQLGQNFLHDQNLAKWLAEHAVAGLDPGATVVEIGPGLGALTSVLLEKKCPSHRAGKRSRPVRFSAGTFRRGNRARQLRLARGRRAGNAAPARGDARRHLRQPALLYFDAAPDGMPAAAGRCRRGFFSSSRRKSGSAWPACRETRPTARSRFWCRRATTWRWSARCPARFFIRRPRSSRSRCNSRRARSRWLRPADRERFAAVVQRGFSQRRKKLSNLLPTDDGRRAEQLSPAEWVELWRQIEKRTTVLTGSLGGPLPDDGRPGDGLVRRYWRWRPSLRRLHHRHP